MRKLICIFLVAILAFLSSSIYAENQFAFRNGIMFGDSIAEVQAKETYELTLDDDGDTLSCSNITVATIDNSSIHYYFKNGKLNKLKLPTPKSS